VGFALLASGSARAQIPDKFTNLKVLPKNISKDELVSTMRGFSMALGVRCDHCHFFQEATRHGDFASDEKKQKDIARGMLRMVKEINGKLVPKAGVENPMQVRCVTCHHGVARPQTLADVLKEAIQKDGVAAAEPRYKELREKYYGSGAYDFRPGSLSAVADWLANERKDLDGGISVMRFNIGLDPNVAESHAILARMMEEKGDKAAAIEGFKNALELEPENPRVQQALKRLESGQ
ncbi:MAG: c-type cytochrome, partial [Candidatus Latescibacteria bacterium]|nr:c-type cytochrome [Candidatus Latescibacterota bacterium]